MSAGVVESPAVRTALPLRIPGVPRDGGGTSIRFPPEISDAGGTSTRFPPETSGAGAPP